ncbi:MAG TPA: hypothetical protein DEF79_12465 [Gammaproteobacteria bacterium]|nr:hypothetical protein [Gammaproteobacteria bacterium]
MQGTEHISSATRVISSVSPSQLVIRIKPEVANELGLREGQTVRSAVSEDGKSIQLFSENSSKTFSMHLGAFKGQNIQFRLAQTPQGLTLQSGQIVQESTHFGVQSNQNPNNHLTENAKWVQLLSQNPSLQQAALLQSGASLLKAFLKRGFNLGKDAEVLSGLKLEDLSAKSIKAAFDFSGALGKFQNKRAGSRSESKSIVSLLKDLKSIESQEGSQNTLIEDIEASIRYLSNSKLKTLINKQNGLRSSQFFIPLQGLPSVEVKINELSQVSGLSVKDEPAPSLIPPQSSFTYEDPRFTLTEKAQSADSFEGESDGTPKDETDQAESGENNEQDSSDSPELESESTNDSAERDDKHNANKTLTSKGDWSLDLDWHLSEGDSISIHAISRKREALALTFWISSEQMMSLAREHKGRLLSQISSLSFGSATCQFIEGVRPASRISSSSDKSSFSVET